MAEVNFLPYVGPFFRTGTVRLLIIGESHYGEPDPDPAEATRTVVNMWRAREWKPRYLTVAARVLTGQIARQIDRKTVFDGVAFYNFIQVPMRKIQVRPTPVQALASWGAFRETLTTCDPTHIVATGDFLWKNMPLSDRRDGNVVFDGETVPRREYATPGGYASAIALPHLSRASAPRWHGPVHAFLAS